MGGWNCILPASCRYDNDKQALKSLLIFSRYGHNFTSITVLHCLWWIRAFSSCIQMPFLIRGDTSPVDVMNCVWEGRATRNERHNKSFFSNFASTFHFFLKHGYIQTEWPEDTIPEQPSFHPKVTINDFVFQPVMLTWVTYNNRSFIPSWICYGGYFSCRYCSWYSFQGRYCHCSWKESDL